METVQHSISCDVHSGKRARRDLISETEKKTGISPNISKLPLSHKITQQKKEAGGGSVGSYYGDRPESRHTVLYYHDTITERSCCFHTTLQLMEKMETRGILTVTKTYKGDYRSM